CRRHENDDGGKASRSWRVREQRLPVHGARRGKSSRNQLLGRRWPRLLEHEIEPAHHHGRAGHHHSFRQLPPVRGWTGIDHLDRRLIHPCLLETERYTSSITLNLLA